MERKIKLAIAIVLIIAAIFYLQATTVHPQVLSQKEVLANNSVSLAAKSAKYSPAADFVNPTGFINTDNFTLKQLVGSKIILLDFWTYSCINCQRTIPFLNAWYEKYEASGFVVVGVHTPEFEFEKNIGNVKQAVQQFGIKYPVVLDSEYGTWSAYNNHYWPAEYLIDVDGFVVNTHFGEGDYEETESKIVELLKEKADREGGKINMNESVATPAAVQAQTASPETYFGAARNEFLANGEKGRVGVQEMAIPQKLEGNQLYLGGTWNFTPEYATNLQGNAKITFTYYAKGIYLVASSQNESKIIVTLDGKPVSQEIAGEAIRFEGNQSFAVVKEAKLYRLVQSSSPEQHTLEIMVVGNGLRAYTFTFG